MDFKKVDVGVLYETLRRLDENKKQRRKHPKQLDLEQWIKDKENELVRKV